MFNLITDLEKEAFIRHIEHYAAEEQYPTEPINLEFILRYWNQKDTLFKLLGNNLILSKPISVKATYDTLYEEWDNLLNENPKAEEFYRKIKEVLYELRWANVQSKYNVPLTPEMIEKIDQGSRYISWNMEPESIIKNSASFEFSLPLPNGKTLKCSEGMKMMKVLSKFAKAFNIEGFEDFRIFHSQTLNQKKLSGNLCLSIHPLDYATMSDNNCGWSSCMSWLDHGDYRQGTVEMMNSPVVLVAYLASDKTSFLMGNDLKWNNKKWRQLIVVTPETLIGYKQYPYSNDELQGEVMRWVRELAIQNLGWNQFPVEASLVNNYRDNIIGDKSIYFNFYTHMMYNDFGTNFMAYVSNNLNPGDRIDYSISGPAECLFCGDIHCIDENSYLVCSDCGGGHTCSTCGCSVPSDEIYWHGDECYCPDCWNDVSVMCEGCEDYQHEDAISTLAITHNDKVVVSTNLCDWCRRNATQRLAAKNLIYEYNFGNSVEYPEITLTELLEKKATWADLENHYYHTTAEEFIDALVEVYADNEEAFKSAITILFPDNYDKIIEERLPF